MIPVKNVAMEKEEEEEEEEEGGMCATITSVATVLLSIPALVGS